LDSNAMTGYLMAMVVEWVISSAPSVPNNADDVCIPHPAPPVPLPEGPAPQRAFLCPSSGGPVHHRSRHRRCRRCHPRGEAAAAAPTTLEDLGRARRHGGGGVKSARALRRGKPWECLQWGGSVPSGDPTPRAPRGAGRDVPRGGGGGGGGRTGRHPTGGSLPSPSDRGTVDFVHMAYGISIWPSIWHKHMAIVARPVSRVRWHGFHTRRIG